jgi:hypothetical protein
MTRTRGEVKGRGLVVIAAFIILAGGIFAIRDYWFMRHAVEAEGKVIGSRERRVKRSRGEFVRYIPTVEFSDAKGQAYRIEPEQGVRSPIPVGTTIPVFYPPSQPNMARIGGQFYWTWSAWLPCVGLVVLLFGVALIIVSRGIERLWPGSLKPARHTGDVASGPI